jgi:acetoin utilization deacetylase AcuC-like enzyme
MGFCIFNNVAVAARMATDEYGLDRVLIVDWDVHHGNGTQAVFWDDPKVAFFSIHRWPFYPGTGAENETGVGDGAAPIVNRPVPLGISREDYLAVFSATLEELAAKVKPQLVLVSAGFDTHRLDPVGSLGLETEDFIPLTREVLEVAETYAEGKLVSVLEGGYDPQILADCVEVHLAEMLDRDSTAVGNA